MNSETLDIETWLKKMEIEQLIRTCAKVLDHGEFEKWIDLFTDDCKYKSITIDNYEKNYVLGVMDDNKNRMRDRVEVIRKWWNVEETKIMHFVSNIDIELVGKDRAKSQSYFSIFETDRFGETGVQCVGRYIDLIVLTGAGWKFKERLAVLDTHLLTEMYVPI